jgi:hypothetical protein
MLKIESFAVVNPITRAVYWTAEAWRGTILLAQCNAQTKADATRAALREACAPAMKRRAA